MGLSVYTGPAYSQHQIESAIQSTGLTDSPQIEKLSFHDNHSLCEKVSELLAQEKVVGWFKGRMEFGPRALGNRSIIADPRCPGMQNRINHEIKFRESFRPFAPVVLASRANRYFDIPAHFESPHMLFAEKVKPIPQTADATKTESEHSLPLPAITHVNQSARIQTVTREQNDNLAQLLETFEEKTGCPVLLNTSLNVRGQPIACSPDDALAIFSSTALDALVMENCLLMKTGEPKTLPTEGQHGQPAAERENHRQFALYRLPLTGMAGGLITYGLGGSLSWSLLIVSISLLLFVTGLVAPRILAPLASALGVALRFTAILFTMVMMLLVFYLLLTPYALLLRILRHRGLQTGFESDSPSYWKPRKQPESKSSYFRQF
jgi:hypothetical protein